MGVNTSISWTNSTRNPIRGCSRVSEGCRNCYAESVAYRFSGEGMAYEGLVRINAAGQRKREWNGTIKFVEEHFLDPLHWTKPRRIFVNSMSDLFHENVSEEICDKIFAVMSLCPQHTFQILTKRPDRMREYLTQKEGRRVVIPQNGIRSTGGAVWTHSASWPLPNVWIGTSVENQKTFDERVPHLVGAPAAVRFLSAEPLLGPIDMVYPKTLFPIGPDTCCNGRDCGCMGMPVDPPMLYGIDWVITGGESGHHARPMPSKWVDDIRKQCKERNVKFFHKQNGEWVDAGHEAFGRLPSGKIKHLRSDGTEWDVVPIDESADVITMKHVGRKRAGDTLYGKLYHEFPDEVKA